MVFVRVGQVARVTGISVRTLQALTAEGLVPSYKFGHSRLFKIAEVIAAIETTRESTVCEVLA